MMIDKIETINNVIEVIKSYSKNDYNLVKCFNEEYNNHCNCAGSDCLFIFNWENKQYEITSEFTTKLEEIKYSYKIIF